jgi:kynurenine formamidase
MPPGHRQPLPDPFDVLAALQTVHTGRAFDLGVDLGPNTPRLPPNEVAPYVMSQFRTPASFRDNAEMQGVSFSNEVVYGGLHQSCHIDSLIHCQHEGKVHGGKPVDELLGDFGWSQHGAETIAPIVRRGVVIDIATTVGLLPVPDGYGVTPEDLEAAVANQRLELKPHDAILLRTGKITQFNEHREAFEAGCPGLSADGARWLADRGMALFGLDATSADANPVTTWHDMTHVELLVRRGIHIIENLYLEDLVGAGVSEFLFVCLPLRLQGATGSWVRPIAIT